MGKLWQHYGRALFLAAGIGAGAVLSLPLASDSQAKSTRLDNGVRAWDRSGFQTIRPPRPGQKRFAPNRRGGTASRPRKEHHGWFWKTEDPKAAARPDRWAAALDILRSRRLSHGALIPETRIERLAERWGAPVKAVARRHGVSEALILAVIAIESAGNPRAVSPKGATGLMQLMPATGRRFGVSDRTDPEQNLAGGTAYLDFLLERFRGDVVLALAAYNAGENAVDRHGGVPPYAETRDYVVKVLDALLATEPLCAAPPEGPRQACLLRRVSAPPA